MNLRIGTSGYSYDDWHGPFYPPGLPRGSRFSYYAANFDLVELNFTFYRQPEAAMLEKMSRQAPDGFTFCVKANRQLTHERSEDPAPQADVFLRGVQPLLDDGKMGAILLQFPWSFKHSPENRDYIRRLKDALGDLSQVVEFRNAAWLNDDTYQLLRDIGLGLCAVDEPQLRGLLPPVCLATSNTGYVRFHGRNAAKWYDHAEAWERYDYLYEIEELKQWVPRINKLGEDADVVYVFTNNHRNGQAVTNAGQLRELFDIAPPQGGGGGGGGTGFPGGSGSLFPGPD